MKSDQDISPESPPRDSLSSNAGAVTRPCPVIRVPEQRERASAAKAALAPFTVWSIDDLDAFQPPKDDAILADNDGSIHLRAGMNAALIGPGGCGKSRLLIDVAIKQILGEDFVGFKMPGPARRWLVCGNENSAVRYKRELGARLAGLTTVQRAKVRENLFLQIPDAPGSGDDSYISLESEENIARWKATAAAIKPQVVTVDPWEAAIVGGDCNNSAATRQSLALLRSIFTPHVPTVTVLIVHHAREGAENIRKAEGFDAGAFGKGSRTLNSMVRFSLNMAPTDPQDGGKAMLAAGKANDGRKFSARGIVLSEATMSYSLDHDFDLDSWRNDVEGKAREAMITIADLVAIVNEGTHATGDIIRLADERFSASKRTTIRVLNRACDAGYLARVLRGKYSLGMKRIDKLGTPHLPKKPASASMEDEKGLL